MSDNSGTRGRPWSLETYALFGLVLGLALWAVRLELGDIFRVALRDEEQSHILLVPAIAAWLLYLRRGRLRFVRFQPNPIGLGVLAGAWTMIWLGYETDTIVFQHVGAMAFVLGAVISIVGVMIIRQFLPIVLVFAFFVPVPGTIRQMIAIPLQQMAVLVTQAMLDLVGVMSERVGNSITVNGTNVAVGEACNGMRMVFALTLTVYAFVFSVPLRQSTKRLLLLLSPGVALLCNVVRLVPTALVYGYGSVGTAEQFHDIAGWIMLPIALGLLIAVLRLLNWMDMPVRQWRLAQ